MALHSRGEPVHPLPFLVLTMTGPRDHVAVAGGPLRAAGLARTRSLAHGRRTGRDHRPQGFGRWGSL
jgi:hypothetical protein